MGGKKGKRRKTCLTELLAFYIEVTSLVDEGKDVVYLDFNKVFDTLYLTSS